VRRAPDWAAPLLAMVLVATLVAGIAAAARHSGPEQDQAADAGAGAGAGTATAPPEPDGPGLGDATPPADGTRPGGADDGGPLAATLLVPPPQFVRLADDTVGTGALDAGRAPALDGFGGLPPEELGELGLVRGHSRAWQSDSGVLLGIAYEFGDDEAATTFTEQAAASREADPGYTRSPLAEVPDAVVLSSTDDDGATTVVLLAAGPRAYVLGLSQTSGEATDRSLLVDLARRQSDAGRGAGRQAPGAPPPPADEQPAGKQIGPGLPPG
jgi:hypothetical protein